MCQEGCKGKCGCNMSSITKGEKGDQGEKGDSGLALPYKLYNAILNQSISSQTSGSLVVGKQYTVYLNAGDNFSNVGYIADNTPFTATGTTPTVWTNASYVVDILLSQPTAVIVYDTITGISVSYNPVTNAIDFTKNGAFFLNKTMYDKILGGVSSLLRLSNDVIAWKPTNVTDQPIEIKVYL